MPIIKEQDELVAIAKAKSKDVVLLCVMGSVVYGVAGPESDVDYLLVSDSASDALILKEEVDIVVKNTTTFIEGVRAGSVFFIEGLFSPPEFSLVRRITTPPINKTAVAVSALERAQSDFKKGMATENPKRVFHALRVLDYGHQIVSQGKIVSFLSVADLYEDIMTSPDLSEFSALYEEYCERLKA